MNLILYEDGNLMEQVGWYTGSAGNALKIYKDLITGLYYLEQNPYSGSIFATAKRTRGFPIYWEIKKYPHTHGDIEYTGNIVFLFQLLKRAEVFKILADIAKKEQLLRHHITNQKS